MKYIRKISNENKLADLVRSANKTKAYVVLMVDTAVCNYGVHIIPAEDPFTLDPYDSYDPYDVAALSLRGEAENSPFTEVYYSASEKSPLFMEGTQMLGATVVSHDFDETESVGCVTLDANVSEDSLHEAFPNLEITYIDGAE